MMRTRLILVFVLLLTAGDALAQRVDARISSPNPDTVRLGEEMQLTLEAIHGFASQPEFPAADTAFGDFIPLGPPVIGSRMIDDDVRLDSAVYNVTTFALDTARLPPLTVLFDSGAVSLQTDSLERLITSVLPVGADTILGMTDPVAFERPLWPYVLLGLAACAIGALIWYLIRRRRKPEVLTYTETKPSRPPHLIALERLRALEQAPLAKHVHIEAYYVELSDALRTYIEARLDVPALESTTAELVRDLAQSRIQHILPAGMPQSVERVLSLSDLVKFAELEPQPEQSRETLTEAIQIIERVETKIGQVEARADATTDEEPAS